MRLKKLKYIAPALLAVAFLASCSSDDVVQNGQDNNNNGEVAGVVFEGATQTPASRASRMLGDPSPTTRTTATHSIGQGAKVAWEAADNIWVEDDGGTFHVNTSMAFPNPGDKSEAKFGLATGSFTGTTHKVVYTGKGSTSATEVEIKASQTQTATNSFAHLGESGDCGIATATGSAGKYRFTLEHKAAYLCFLPRCLNSSTNPAINQNVFLTKIKVTADKPIAGTFDFSDGSLAGKTPTAGSSYSVTLTTNSFPLNTTYSDITKNGAYMVIAPGTSYDLIIDYTIKDPTTNVETTLSKKVKGIACPEGKIQDISANLTPRIKPEYYMWGAEKPYWYGYNKPYNPSDAPQPGDPNGRYYDTSTTIPYEAQPAAFEGKENIPNANEMAYYVQYGDIHWESFKNIVLAENSHLEMYSNYRILWIRKKSAILDYLHNNGFPTTFSAADMKNGYKSSASAAPIDLRTTVPGPTSLPYTGSIAGAPADPSDYFILPHSHDIGPGYNNGIIIQSPVPYITAPMGTYWTSTLYPGGSNQAYIFNFKDNSLLYSGSPGYMQLSYAPCSKGYSVVPFE